MYIYINEEKDKIYDNAIMIANINNNLTNAYIFMFIFVFQGLESPIAQLKSSSQLNLGLILHSPMVVTAPLSATKGIQLFHAWFREVRTIIYRQ